jgi:ABC-type sugar transport system permease subunit
MLTTARRGRGGLHPGPSGGPNGRALRARPRTARRRRVATPYLLLLPSAVAIGLLLVWPAIQLGLFSFQRYGDPQINGVAPTDWVGWANYSQILHDSEFWTSLRLTVVFAAVVVTLTMIVGTLVGLLLNQLRPRMAAFVSTAALLAWATPAVSASVIFIWLFSPDGGIVDWGLSHLPSWLGGGAHWSGFNWTTGSALPAYTLITLLIVWQSFPFVAVSVLAGLKTVPGELLDAAHVDGAGAWRVFWKVLYPLLKPIFLVLLLMSVIWDFGIFTQTYVVTGGLSNLNEWNLGIYAYAQANTMPPEYGLAAAGGLVLTVVLLIVTVAYVRSTIRAGEVA